uniref:Tetratricopeptide repeat protein n=1 Tax=Romanomermis culicivorax TaxID=13658 RepID=A0A915HV85_ROMCU
MSTKDKQNIENALNNLLRMDGQTNNNENSDVSNVGAILGIARAHMMLKQTPKAKAQLKKVLGRSWSFEDADYLEQCWLLLADLYINQLKYDVATELLQTCLKHNASCVKSMEFLGYIREKEQKWIEATAYYEKAWLLTKMKNPTIGYKLAFNQLKSKRFIDAIDICHTVLKQYPNYPKIKRDVLDKARANLRI